MKEKTYKDIHNEVYNIAVKLNKRENTEFDYHAALVGVDGYNGNAKPLDVDFTGFPAIDYKRFRPLLHKAFYALVLEDVKRISEKIESLMKELDKCMEKTSFDVDTLKEAKNVNALIVAAVEKEAGEVDSPLPCLIASAIYGKMSDAQAADFKSVYEAIKKWHDKDVSLNQTKKDIESVFKSVWAADIESGVNEYNPICDKGMIVNSLACACYGDFKPTNGTMGQACKTLNAFAVQCVRALIAQGQAKARKEKAIFNNVRNDVANSIEKDKANKIAEREQARANKNEQNKTNNK